jgi:hypothetical protein
MKNFFSTGKTSANKIFLEIDKKITEIDKNVESIFSNKSNKSQADKKLIQISKEIDFLYKTIFDMKTFTTEIFEYFIEKNFIQLLISYIGLHNIDLIKIIIPYLQKILFESNKIYEKVEISEEILLMNFSIINSLKIFIHTLISIFNENSFDEDLVSVMINFLYCLLNKFLIYSNFYLAISSSNSFNSDQKNLIEQENNFDSALFELIIEIFSKEHIMTQRENKSKTRKTLLLCLNLENFYTIKLSYIEKMIEYLVENLVRYYENYKLFQVDKFLSNTNKQILQIFKKEKITNEELSNLFTQDLISYLRYFSIILHCFSAKEIKTFLSNLLFNKLFLEYIQKDFLNIYIVSENERKLVRVMEFIYYFTKHIKNKEITQLLFFFFFGFNNYITQLEIDPDVNDFIIDENQEESVDDVVNEESFMLDENLLSMQEIRKNLDKIIINNVINSGNNKKSINSNFNLNIEKSSHKFENILTFFINIVESNSPSLNEVKIILLNFMTNMVKNSSNLFLIEILIPYYLNYITLQSPQNFEKLYEKIKSKREKIDMIEILKNIHPKFFTIDLNNWSEYFESNLEKNYDRNIFMLENIEEIKLDEKNEIDLIENEITYRGSLFLGESNFFSNENFNTMNSSRKIVSTNYTDSDELFFNNSMYNSTGNQFSNSGNKFGSSVPNSHSSQSFNKENLFNNNTLNSRIQFYDALTRYFKRFLTNKYTENLYLTQLFLEIYSLPYLVQMGEQGEGLYNIYSNITYAGKKKFVFSKISSVGIIGYIVNKLDESVRFIYNKEEISSLILKRIQEKKNFNFIKSDKEIKAQREQEIFKSSFLNTSNFFSNTNNSPSLTKFKTENTCSDKNVELIDNLIVFSEFYKEYLSNIFAKCYFDQINTAYANRLSEIDLNNYNQDYRDYCEFSNK